MDVFDMLTICAVIEGKVFCVHGGLSPDIKSLDQIRLINRVMEVPMNGPMTDMMWSDPDDVENWAIASRGAGWIFGWNVTNKFNHINNLSLIARAH